MNTFLVWWLIIGEIVVLIGLCGRETCDALAKDAVGLPRVHYYVGVALVVIAWPTALGAIIAGMRRK